MDCILLFWRSSYCAIVGTRFVDVRFITIEPNTIYWSNTLLFSYLCFCYEVSNKLDYLYGKIFLNSMQNLIHIAKETGFEISQSPKLFSKALLESIMPPQPPDKHTNIHRSPKVPLGFCVRQKQRYSTHLLSLHWPYFKPMTIFPDKKH